MKNCVITSILILLIFPLAAQEHVQEDVYWAEVSPGLSFFQGRIVSTSINYKFRNAIASFNIDINREPALGGLLGASTEDGYMGNSFSLEVGYRWRRKWTYCIMQGGLGIVQKKDFAWHDHLIPGHGQVPRTVGTTLQPVIPLRFKYGVTPFKWISLYTHSSFFVTDKVGSMVPGFGVGLGRF